MIAGFVRRVCVAIAVLLLAAPASWAQNGGSISGAVVDPLGARVSGATLKLMLAGKEVKSGTSDSMGDFTFDGLAEGRYQIEASSPGFQTRTTDPMFVGGSGKVTVDVALPIGPLEQNVSVTAAATDVLPSQIGAPVTVLDSTTLGALGKPDVLEGLRLVPGVSLVQTGARGGVTSIFVRGGNSNFNKVLIDGIPANDIGGSVDLSQYSVAGIERVEALRDPNSVVFGSDALSGVVSLISKRGQYADSRGDVLARRRQSRHASRVGVDRRDGAALRLLQRVRQSRHGQRPAEQQVPHQDLRGTVRRRARPQQRSQRHRPLDRSPLRIAQRRSASTARRTTRSRISRRCCIGLSSQTQITDKWQATARFGSWDGRGALREPDAERHAL